MGTVLTTPRLIMRHLTLQDQAALAPILQDIEVMYAWEHAFSDSEVTDWITENLMRYQRDGYSYWAVIHQQTGALIGVCGIIAETADGDDYTGIGYLFAKAFWQQGYALEAATACKEYAESTLGIKKLTAQIRTENRASRRLAEKLGMTVKKEFVKRYRGKAMPHLLYGFDRDSGSL